MQAAKVTYGLNMQNKYKERNYYKKALPTKGIRAFIKEEAPCRKQLTQEKAFAFKINDYYNTEDNNT